jgi:hypothetical protein
MPYLMVGKSSHRLEVYLMVGKSRRHLKLCMRVRGIPHVVSREALDGGLSP